MLDVSSSGSFDRTLRYLDKLRSGRIYSSLNNHGAKGVAALSRATPKETGRAGQSWDYEIERGRGFYTIHWINTDEEGGANVAVLIQYGHGTGTGGYVQGRDYINPAIRPIFDRIAEDVWKEVTNA